MVEINWLQELMDTIGSLSGKYARWLNIKKNPWCFIIWAVLSMYWMLRDFYVGFYSQGIFCLISLGLHLYGWYTWKNKGE